MRAETMKAWINKNMDKYVKLLHLEDWTIKVYIVTKINLVSNDNDNSIDFCAAGNCFSRHEYKLARTGNYSFL